MVKSLANAHVPLQGGIYRGTDVVKALCLGAKAVGLGRAFLFAQSVSSVPPRSRTT
jgi:L-lactate dehydrogenase (cytochrome)